MRTSKILLISVWLFGCAFSARATSEPKAGGDCDYKRYEGVATIVSISPKASAKKNSRQTFEVKFTFEPNNELAHEATGYQGREFLLLQEGSRYPDAEFLAKHDITLGKTLACHMLVIQKGTCTPRMFDFPGLRGAP